MTGQAIPEAPATRLAPPSAAAGPSATPLEPTVLKPSNDAAVPALPLQGRLEVALPHRTGAQSAAPPVQSVVSESQKPPAQHPLPVSDEQPLGGKPVSSAPAAPAATVRIPAVLPQPVDHSTLETMPGNIPAARPRLESGTASAQTLPGMKPTVNQEQSTARTMQKLPVGVPLEPLTKSSATAADGTAGSPRLRVDRDRAAALEMQPWDWIQRGLSAESVRAERAQGLTGEKAAAYADALTARLERSIAREVVTVRQLNVDSLTVVLRPDPGSEIVLSLRQHNGQVEASARCGSATWQALNRDWSGLQEALAQMNVRLLPLEKSPGPMPLPQPGQDNPNGSGESAQLAGRFARQHDLPDRRTHHPASDEPTTERKSQPLAHAQPVRASRYPAPGWASWA